MSRQYKYEANTGYGRYSSSRETWGKICIELIHNRARLHKAENPDPVISYDDILDVQLVIRKGI